MPMAMARPRPWNQWAKIASWTVTMHPEPILRGGAAACSHQDERLFGPVGQRPHEARTYLPRAGARPVPINEAPDDHGRVAADFGGERDGYVAQHNQGRRDDAAPPGAEDVDKLPAKERHDRVDQRDRCLQEAVLRVRNAKLLAVAKHTRAHATQREKAGQRMAGAGRRAL